MSDPIARLNTALSDRYRIERELGRGGMATVYVADDLKHQRKVAVKVLRPDLAAVVGGDRFLAEIRTTANLQHPHILPLFDSGEVEGLLWYAMPYVEGESLRERLDREKQLPVDETVRIATRVLGALGAAHDAGIVHRDIKPANILLDARGEPLVADFGIALAVQESGGGRLTETGLSVGTPYYMSPEQATGDRPPDARADLYSLGCVLYEMLTGEPPFQGATAQAVLGRIISGRVTPPMKERISVPPNVNAAVLTALERLPADRFANAGDFTAALRDPSYGRPATGGDTGAEGRIPLGAGLVAAVVVAVAAFAAGRWLSVPSTTPGSETEILTDLGVQAHSGIGVQLTPAGGVVYTRSEHGEFEQGSPLTYRPPASPTPVELSSRGWGNAVVSPDGRFAVQEGVQGGVTRIPLDGGQPTVLLPPVARGDGGVISHQPEFWTEDGLFLSEWDYSFTSGLDHLRLVRLTPETRELREVFDVSEWPFVVTGWTPGPDEALFMTAYNVDVTFVGDTTRILGLRPASGDTSVVVERGAHPHWVESGHLVYLQPDGEIMAVPVDASTLEPSAPAFALGMNVGGWHAGSPVIDVRNGRLAHLSNAEMDLTRETFDWVYPASGERTPLRLPPRDYTYFSLSPDGRRLLVREGIGSVPQRVEELTTGSRTPLETREDMESRGRVGIARWSPDSDVLAWFDRAGRLVVARGPDLAERDTLEVPTPGGANAVYRSIAGWPLPDVIEISVWRPGGDGVYRLRFEAGEVRLDERDPPWDELIRSASPDRRWVATNESLPGAPRTELWIRPWPSLEGGTLVATADTASFARWWGQAAWTDDGRTFVYTEGDSIVVAAFSVDGGEPRVTDRRRIENPLNRSAGYDVLHVAPDGRLLDTSNADPESALPPHERNRVMLLTGLEERILRMDPNRSDGGGS